MRKIALGGVIALAVLAALLTVPSALAAYPANSTYLNPEDSAGVYCENSTVVQIRVNTSVSNLGGGMDIYFDKNCVIITAANFTGTAWSHQRSFHNFGNYARIGCMDWAGNGATGDVLFATITLHCITDTSNCTSYLNFGGLTGWVDATPEENPIDLETHNGTFTCGEASTSCKDLYEGWNLVSLPLTPEDSSTNAVLSSVSENYDAVYKYDAGLHSFVIANTMDPGTGYFINMTANDTWTYEGMSYESIDVELSQGLNMLGWLNCTKDISDALSSIENNYRYVARWNAISQSYEVYVPGAPEVFNDFVMMERGEGYWIVAKQDCTLTGSCPS